MGGLRVWVTRAQPGAAATATRLAELGHVPLVESLLSVELLALPEQPGDEIGAVAFTSANAMRAFAAWTARRDWPVFAVGDATAAAARSLGFETISSAGADVAALADHIAARSPKGVVLYPCAQERAGDLAGALSTRGVRVEVLTLYQTIAATRVADAADQALQRAELDVVLLHSPKAARVLATLLAGRRPAELERVLAIGLSQACLDPIAHLAFKDFRTAVRPDEASLLERLG